MSVRRDSPFDEIVDSGDEAVNRAAVLLTRMQHRLNPSAEFRTSLQRHVLEMYATSAASAVDAPRGRSLSSPLRRASAATAASAVLLVGTVGAVSAAQDAVPGDPLYGVKRTVEEVRIFVTLGQDRAELLGGLMAERRLEIEVLAARGDWDATRTATADLVEHYRQIVALGGDREAAGRDAIAALEWLLSVAPAPEHGSITTLLSETRVLTESEPAGRAPEPAVEPAPVFDAARRNEPSPPSPSAAPGLPDAPDPAADDGTEKGGSNTAGQGNARPGQQRAGQRRPGQQRAGQRRPGQQRAGQCRPGERGQRRKQWEWRQRRPGQRREQWQRRPAPAEGNGGGNQWQWRQRRPGQRRGRPGNWRQRWNWRQRRQRRAAG